MKPPTQQERIRLAADAGALSCPFCGAPAEAEPWHGGGIRKHHVGCSGDHCAAGPGCTGSTLALAVSSWNRRAPA
jgi:hypothetical protein